MRLRPHGRVLLVPVVVLLLACAAGGFAAARLPPDEGPLRAAVALALLLVVLRACAVPFLRWHATTLTVTDRRVRTRHGVLRSRTRDVDLRRVADVVVERSLGQRLLGTGTLLLDTVGERGSVVLRDVPGVRRVAAALADLLEELPLDDVDDSAWFDARAGRR